MYLLDTNCFIYLYTGRFPTLTRRVEETAGSDLGLSTIVYAELVIGGAQGKAPAGAALERLVRQLAVLPFDAAAARAYALVPFRRARFDRLLAAHALALGATLVTNNVADFADVPGLRIENWTVAG